MGIVKSLESLWRCILANAGMQCGVSTDRDCKTASVRSQHEGLSFYTITLPVFASDFQKSLDLGQVGHDHFVGFSRSGGLPRFLGGFLDLVFDRGTGTLLDVPDIDAIAAIRQITMLLGKLFVHPTDRRVNSAFRQYIETEKEVKAHDRRHHEVHGTAILLNAGSPVAHGGDGIELQAPDWRESSSRPDPRRLAACGRSQSSMGYARTLPGLDGDTEGSRLRSRLNDVHRSAVLLFGRAVRKIERTVQDPVLFDSARAEAERLVFLVPRHGPGATADRLKGNQKFQVNQWPTRLAEFAHPGEWLLPNHRFQERLDDVLFLTPEQEIPVRVIAVPKTMKTARIIAMEPTAMMYVQQAIACVLVVALERDPLVGGLIGFLDQVPNQELAREGSLDGSLATLDLSEASDRVSNQHVLGLLAQWPAFSEAVQACRSRKADVRGHGVIRLSKFASMGSALTFPLEAMFFLSIVVSAVASVRGVPVTVGFIRSLHGQVRVYGDDIIVPSDCAVAVSEWLEDFGLRVNPSKSFWTGKFRESCGEDFYDGHRVTPVRVRHEFPTSRKDAEEVMSLVSLRNQLYEAGYWATVQWLDNQIVEILPHFPIVDPTSPIIGRTSAAFHWKAEAADPDTYAPLVKGYTSHATIPDIPLDGVDALMKWFLTVEGREIHEPLDRDHLLRSGRASSTHIKTGWRTPY